MANSKKISRLDDAASIDGSETIPLVQSGVTKKATLDDIIPIARTPAETTAGVTPVDYRYPEGHVLRYGTNTTPGTTDMTTAFSNALSVGKPVFFSPGTYLLTDDVTPPSDISISADPGSVTITKADGATHNFITLSSVSNVTISGIKFDGKRRNAGGVTGKSVEMTSTTNVVIERCHFYDGWNIFVNEGCSNIRVANNFFEDGKSGFGTGTSGGTMVSDLVITGNYFTGQSDEGIDLNYNTQRAIISNNVFVGAGTDVSGGGESIDVGGETHNDIIISNNVIDLDGNDMRGMTIKVNGTGSTTQRVVIEGNAITNGGTTSGAGIYVTHPDYVSITGNVISDMYNGIYVTTSASNVQITGNVVFNAVFRALTVEGSASIVHIDGNLFDATGVSDYAVYIEATASDWSFTNNRVIGGTRGLQIDSGASGGRIADNDISDADAYGIFCNASQTTIIGNRIHDNGTHGIGLQACEYSTISNNVCYDNDTTAAGSYGILVNTSCNFLTLTGNVCTGTNQNGMRVVGGCDRIIITSNMLYNNAGGTNLTVSGTATNVTNANNITA